VKQKITPRKTGEILDVIHLILGLAIIIMAVFAIANPDKNKVLFPLIFFLASMINIATSFFQFKMFPRNRKKQISSLIYLITGLLMVALGVISAVSIWGN